MKFGERPRHLEDLDGDPSWRPRKPKPAPLVCACGQIHAFVDDRGELQTCNHCCKRHIWKGR